MMYQRAEAMEYEVIRSRRRTMGAEIKGTRLIIRAPLYATNRSIERFVRQHEDWIIAHLAKALEREKARQACRKLTPEELKALKIQARKVIRKRVAYYAPIVGVSYGTVSIRSQRTKWGSCSAKGNLSFNCLLMLAPTEVLDSVVVHELCHRKEMNHSKRFYAEVLRVFPEYRKWNKWLKENGWLLTASLDDH